MRTQLILLLVALVLVATATTGTLAYRTSRSLIAGAEVREVGSTANARRQAVVQMLTEQRGRAAALLKTISAGCAPEELRCLQKVLGGFVATEGARGVELQYPKRAPVVVGDTAGAGDGETSGTLARFEFDSAGRPTYLITVDGVTRDGPMRVTLRGDMRVIDKIFADRDSLGQSGEAFLTDGRGDLLTPVRYSPAPDKEHPPLSQALRSCLAGRDGEILDTGYRGVPVIHGFRHIPEIGGGCAVAVVDQSEAFAPANRLRRDLLGLSASLAALAIACSVLFAQIVSRPIAKLSDYARALQAGDLGSPVPTGGPAEVRMFSVVFAEMTQSLNASRHALEETTERLRNILESIGDSFMAVDRDWLCIYANGHAASLLGLPQDALPGRSLRSLISLSAATWSELERGMQHRAAVHCEEFYEPSDAWFAIDAYPTSTGLVILARDVTERRRLNERLQQTHKLESLGVLAGGIAHDFNNLLTGIIGNASMALEDLPPGDPARLSLQNVVTAGERAAVLTRQLLAYAGKGRFIIQPLDLSGLVREIASLLESSMPRTVTLHLRLSESLPAIEGDAAQIQQLIMNLVINGAEAIAEAAGRVIITTRLQAVDAAYMQQTLAPNEVAPGMYVALEVEDTGCGMDEDTLSRIFDPFFTTKFAGRGLGLAAALGIVRGHRGALAVRSALGQGSRFTVLLPPGDGDPAQPRTAAAAIGSAGQGAILVVEDEEVVREAARSILERLGYAVVTAEDGRQGVELLRRADIHIDLVLLDLTMPVMSGEEALEQLKAIRPDVPVILSSGYDQTEALRRFNGKPLAGFIQKPFTAAHLAEKVKQALNPGPEAGRKSLPDFIP